MRNIIVCFVAVFVIASVLDAAEYRTITVQQPLSGDEDFSHLPLINKEGPGGRSMFTLPPGTVLDSSYYDAQRNGSLCRRVWVNEDGSVHATYMKSIDDGFEQRSMVYYYADQFGGAFSLGIDMASWKNGYGNLAAYPTSALNGAIAVVTTHDASVKETYVYADAYQGLGAFTELRTNVVDQVEWPKPWVNSDGSITVVSTLANNLTVNGIAHNVAWDRATDIATGFSQTWTFLGQDAANWSGANMEWPAVSGSLDGKIGIVIGDFGLDVHFFESTDNGISFAETLITNAAVDTIGLPAGPDSSATVFLPLGNTSLIYAGDEPHIVWTALQGIVNPANALSDFRSRILHWSPSTGIDTVAVARYNSALSGESTYVNPGNRFSVMDWPQIGTNADGTILYLVYSEFTPHDVDPANDIGFGDIKGTFSMDGGETWSDPMNITNPDGSYLGTDDRYPSISPIGYDAAIDPGYEVYLAYQTDDTAGSFVDSEETGNWDYFMFLPVDFDLPSGIEDGGKEAGSLPKAFALHQNYPNPFNPSTTVKFVVPEGATKVDLSVYDSRGRLVTTLYSGKMDSGVHQSTWDGKNKMGETAASGIYFLRMKSDTVSQTIKMVMMK